LSVFKFIVLQCVLKQQFMLVSISVFVLISLYDIWKQTFIYLYVE